MNKVKINLVGGPFFHAFSSSDWDVPKYIEWDKRGGANISVHVDEGMMSRPDKNKKNYAWFLESSAIRQPLINWMTNNVSFLEDNYELIFTYDKRLLSLSNKFTLILPPAVPWIKNCGIHEKTKLISMIVSNKRMCHGHIYRQQVLEKYINELDWFGVGRNKIEKKEEGLNDYYFSIAMENDTYSNYFTQTLTDCFATGTIPIYRGAPSINEFFDERGMIFFTEDFRVSDLSPDLYYSKMEYIKDNFERANKLPIAEDYIYEQYIK